MLTDCMKNDTMITS